MSFRKGFTLVEIITVLILVAVLSAYALPAIKDYSNQKKINQIKQNLVDAINFAQRYAITHKVIVSICPSNNVNTASPKCKPRLLSGASPTNENNDKNYWNNGWIIYQNNNAYKSNSKWCKYDSNTDKILKVFSDIPDDVVITNNLRSNQITYSLIGTYSKCSGGAAGAVFTISSNKKNNTSTYVSGVNYQHVSPIVRFKTGYGRVYNNP